MCEGITSGVIDMVQTGQRIKEIRIKRGLSAKNIADFMGFETPVAVYKWEKGRTLPSLDNLVLLAALLEVKIDDLIITKEYGAKA